MQRGDGHARQRGQVLFDLPWDLPLQAQGARGKSAGHIAKAADAHLPHADLHALKEAGQHTGHRTTHDRHSSSAQAHLVVIACGVPGPQLHPHAFAVKVLARGLFQAGQERVESHCACAQAERLQHPAHVSNLAICQHWDLVGLFPRKLRSCVQCGCIRRAAATHADAVHTCITEVLGLPPGLHTASKEVEALLRVLQSLDEVDRVGEDALVRVDAEEVRSSTDKCLHALPRVWLSRADGGADEEGPVCIPRGVRVLVLPLQVSAAYEGHQLFVLVYNRELCHLRFRHDLPGLLNGHRFPDEQHVLGHNRLEGHLHVVHHVDIAPGDHPQKLPTHLAVVGDGDAAAAALLLKLPRIAHSVEWLERLAMQDEACLVLLHASDHGCLGCNALVPVDDADAALEGHGGGHAGLGHGVRRAAHHWPPQLDVPRDLRRQVHRGACRGAGTWKEDDLIQAVAVRRCKDLLCAPTIHGRDPDHSRNPSMQCNQQRYP
mmetsp:Transcript_119891/g.334484  ORF Transcript_119891/g.334484 Transcript_119891/m.334484 type:complete len:490 (+) Transcript_119891:129-1598(+)